MSNDNAGKDTTPSVAVLVIPINVLPMVLMGWPSDMAIVGSAECVNAKGEMAFYVVSPAWKGTPWPKNGSPRQLVAKRVTGPHTTGWTFELAPLPSNLVGLGGNALHTR